MGSHLLVSLGALAAAGTQASPIHSRTTLQPPPRSVVTIIVRVVYRLVKGRSIREVVPPPGVRAGAADGSDPLGEQRDPLGPDAGEDQRR